MLVTLIFGGNARGPEALVDEAITEVKCIGKIERCSSLYETAPWGFESSDSFITNCYLRNKSTPGRSFG